MGDGIDGARLSRYPVPHGSLSRELRPEPEGFPPVVLAGGRGRRPAAGGGFSPRRRARSAAGVKVSLLDERLNATLSIFDLETTGLLVFGGILPDGRSYNIPAGRTRAKGFDGNISIGLSEGFELVTNFYNGTVKDQLGNPLDDSYESSLGVVGKYSFRTGSAKGLQIGAGGYRISGRVTSTAALTYAAVSYTHLTLPTNREV